MKIAQWKRVSIMTLLLAVAAVGVGVALSVTSFFVRVHLYVGALLFVLGAELLRTHSVGRVLLLAWWNKDRGESTWI